MMKKNNEGEIKNMDIYIFNEKTLDSKKSENKNLNIKSEFIFKNECDEYWIYSKAY